MRAMINSWTCFNSAQRGTIFLDEIGDMAPCPPRLNFCECCKRKKCIPWAHLGRCRPTYESSPQRIGICPGCLAEGRFREDLLYRINVIEVRVPPLRERPDDLEPLIRFSARQTWAGKLGDLNCSVST